MTAETYALLEGYMLRCMGDSAHDKEHVYRVLYTALDIAGSEREADREVLISACLLHDIGRREQFEDPRLDHAAVGAEKAQRFLTAHGFEEGMARRVAACIRTHRFRADRPPESLEARILFDADKLEATGALGIARTLLYTGRVGQPLYSLTPQGRVSDGAGEEAPSFFHEYRYKLEGLYGRFFTRRGEELARLRRQAAADFYQALLAETRLPYERGPALLRAALDG